MKRILAIGAAVLTLVALASCQMAETSGGAAAVGGRFAAVGRAGV